MDGMQYTGQEQVSRNPFNDRTSEIFNRLEENENAAFPVKDVSDPPSRNKSGASDSSPFSFKAEKTTDLTATMLSGGITLGPFTRIEWASITSASTTITVDDATAEWFVWLDVDVRDEAEAASWHEGADMASYWSGLTDEEKKYTTLVPLVYITASDKAVSPDPASWSIDEVKNLQCGDVYIPRL